MFHYGSHLIINKLIEMHKLFIKYTNILNNKNIVLLLVPHQQHNALKERKLK